MTMTFSSKLTWFFNFIGYYYVLQLSSSDVVHATFDKYCSTHNRFGHSFQPGVNYTCSNNDIRITRLVNPLRSGEEPFYDIDSVYFVDALLGTVYRYCIETGQYYSATVGAGNETVGVIIPIEDIPGKFIITYTDNLAILTWDGVSKTVSVRKIGKPDPHHPWPNFFIDDAKIAPNGALFFYTDPFNDAKDETKPPPERESTLFSIFRGYLKRMITNLTFGNGLGYSPDGNWFYYGDSLQNLVFKSFYNQKTNSIEDTCILLNYTDLKIPGYVDSMTVDAEGFVWFAANGGNRIIKVDPYYGQVVCSIYMPDAKLVSNLTFGKCRKSKHGKLDCIYATSLSGENQTDGSLFLIEGVGSVGMLPDKLRLNTVFGHNG